MQRGENAAINDKRHIVGCTLREPNLPVRAPHAPIGHYSRRTRVHAFPFCEYACECVYTYMCLSLSLSARQQRTVERARIQRAREDIIAERSGNSVVRALMRRFDPQQSGAPRFSVEARCLDSTSSSCSRSSCRSTRLPCIDRFHDHRESRFHRSHNSNPFLSLSSSLVLLPPRIAIHSLSLCYFFFSFLPFSSSFPLALCPFPFHLLFSPSPATSFSFSGVLVSLQIPLPTPLPPSPRNFFAPRNKKKKRKSDFERENPGLEVQRDIPAGCRLDFESSPRTETTGSGSNGAPMVEHDHRCWASPMSN